MFLKKTMGVYQAQELTTVNGRPATASAEAERCGPSGWDLRIVLHFAAPVQGHVSGAISGQEERRKVIWCQSGSTLAEVRTIAADAVQAGFRLVDGEGLTVRGGAL